MLVGTLVHELLQGVLDTREFSRQKISALMDSILRSPSTVQVIGLLCCLRKPEITEIVPTYWIRTASMNL